MTRGIAAELVWDGAGFAPGKVVVVEGDTIAGVVDRSAVAEDAVVEDWGPCALVPGTVNAHG
ncbi:MAG TPA: hypothetical protein VIG64_02805, partial [Actinomycetota bacterium]